jgi:hypothetical protein
MRRAAGSMSRRSGPGIVAPDPERTGRWGYRRVKNARFFSIQGISASGTSASG